MNNRYQQRYYFASLLASRHLRRIKELLIDINTDTDLEHYLIDEEKIAKLTEQLLSALNLDEQELSISFVCEKEIQRLNSSYRKKDKATDVLSFPQLVWESPLTLKDKEKLTKNLRPGELLGDIVISLSYADKSAQSIGHSLGREVVFLIIHGLLHLCGHDHMEPIEEALMISEQQKLLQILEENREEPNSTLCFECITNKKDSH